MSALELFGEKTRSWFESAFAEPTPAQALGWPAIAKGGHVLIQAPTGSGKTLAAFLYGLDRLGPTPGGGLRLLYVSPLKALNYDVERIHARKRTRVRPRDLCRLRADFAPNDESGGA